MDALHYQKNEIDFYTRVLANYLFWKDLLQRFHMKNFIHGDLKPENVIAALKASKISLQNVDYGLMLSKRQAEQHKYYTGSETYMAPEVTLNGEQIQKADIYSGGFISNALFGGSFSITSLRTNKEDCQY